MIANKDPKLDEKLKRIWQESQERLTQQKATGQKTQYIDLTKAPIQLDALKLLPEERARAMNAILFGHKGQFTALAVLNPQDELVKAYLAELAAQGTKTNVFEVSKEGLEYAWTFYQFIPKAMASINSRVDVAPEKVLELQKELTTLEKVKEALTKIMVGEIATGEILNIILAGALTNRASDVHLETDEQGDRLRYRIDGELQIVMNGIPKEVYRLVVSRIKLLSNLRLNVSNVSQDGRFTIALGDLQIELRVAVAPSEFGEAIVMRILDPRAINITLPQLGLRPDDLAIIEEELRAPNGMILNTGPTGSGKTTTLYAFLRTLATPDIKIITIEDPIEYHLNGIEQTQVDNKAGYTFANGLRSMMRQDPDIILVGEIRDLETVDIALQAALTGHLVFSTLHTNSSSGVIPCMLDLGAQQVSIGPALNLVIAQRLVRKLCEKCKTPKPIDADLKAKITKFLARMPERVDKKPYEAITEIYEPKKEGDKTGCENCHFTGYRGRNGIFELLRVGDDFEPMIAKHAGDGEIKEFSRQQGIVFLQEDGILRAISGQTSFEEVESVTGPLKDF